MTQDTFDQAMQLLTQINSIKSLLEEDKRKPIKQIKTPYGECIFWLEEFKQDFLDFMGDELEKFQKDFQKM